MKKIIYFTIDFGNGGTVKFLRNSDGTFTHENHFGTSYGIRFSEEYFRSSENATPTYESCSCQLCVEIGPIVKEISEALPPELKEKFNNILSIFGTRELDLEVEILKLKNQWPGC